MIEVTLLGTGSPIPDANRAGPSTLVRAGGQTFLVDCGRAALMRAAAVGVGAANDLTALLSDAPAQRPHRRLVTDVITRDGSRPSTRSGPFDDRTARNGGGGRRDAARRSATTSAIGSRHHPDITGPPRVEVEEVTDGVVWAATA